MSDLALLDPFFLIEGLGALRPPRLRGANILELLGEDEEERVETVRRPTRPTSPLSDAEV